MDKVCSVKSLKILGSEFCAFPVADIFCAFLNSQKSDIRNNKVITIPQHFL